MTLGSFPVRCMRDVRQYRTFRLNILYAVVSPSYFHSISVPCVYLWRSPCIFDDVCFFYMHLFALRLRNTMPAIERAYCLFVSIPHALTEDKKGIECIALNTLYRYVLYSIEMVARIDSRS